MNNGNKISVIGAGSWGTALSKVLTDNGFNVFLWTHNESIAQDINFCHKNSKYLPNQSLPSSIQCSNDIQFVLKDTSLVLFVIPSHAMREVLTKINCPIPTDVHLVHATKGFEISSFKRMSEVMKEFFPLHKISVLSGPSHAEEVVKGFPTTITLASESLEEASLIRDYFMNVYFRVYTSNDVCGVELGGSLKNIYALGTGISDGLGYGDNAKAAILSRGLKEMNFLSTLLGANQETIYGLSGTGDLIVTGTSTLSRNWKTGYLLGKGYSLDDALKEVGMVAEGVKATEAVYNFSIKNSIPMPITQEIYKIIFESKNPKDAVLDLMLRDKKTEF